MNPVARKLIIRGGTLLVASPVVLFVLSFGYGLWSASSFSHAPNSNDHAAYQQFINQIAATELRFLIPVALIATITGFSGFVFLTSGLLRYFCTPKTDAKI
jgi:hypothetical protein